jgi:hypothetical protein
MLMVIVMLVLKLEQKVVFQATLHESCAIYLSAVLEYLSTEILGKLSS